MTFNCELLIIIGGQLFATDIFTRSVVPCHSQRGCSAVG